jgi:hypothetical protein
VEKTSGRVVEDRCAQARARAPSVKGCKGAEVGLADTELKSALGKALGLGRNDNAAQRQSSYSRSGHFFVQLETPTRQCE